MSAKHWLTVNLKDREYQERSALSRKNRVSLAWLGRQAIAECLERYATEERQLPLNLPERGIRRSNGEAKRKKGTAAPARPGAAAITADSARDILSEG